MSIEVKNIHKTYGSQKALDDVSFSVGSSTIVGFLGPNGAGKSTMMKIITGYLPQDSGSVSVCGFDVVEQVQEVKKRVGYLPENNPLYPDMYVREYLLFMAGIHRIDRVQARVNEMIERVGLTLEHRKKIGALSKGYRQRVGLAQAMIHDPEVLILDEPTTGLDPNQIVEIRSLIQSIGRERTVMLSTHIMQEVDAICDRVLIVNKGRLVADDESAHLRNFKSRQVVRVEFNAQVAQNMIATIAGVDEAKRISEFIWLLSSNADKDIRPTVFEFAVTQGITVLTIQKEEQRLEDVFKKLTL